MDLVISFLTKDGENRTIPRTWAGGISGGLGRVKFFESDTTRTCIKGVWHIYGQGRFLGGCRRGGAPLPGELDTSFPM